MLYMILFLSRNFLLLSGIVLRKRNTKSRNSFTASSQTDPFPKTFNVHIHASFHKKTPLKSYQLVSVFAVGVCSRGLVAITSVLFRRRISSIMFRNIWKKDFIRICRYDETTITVLYSCDYNRKSLRDCYNRKCLSS